MRLLLLSSSPVHNALKIWTVAYAARLGFMFSTLLREKPYIDVFASVTLYTHVSTMSHSFYVCTHGAFSVEHPTNGQVVNTCFAKCWLVQTM